MNIVVNMASVLFIYILICLCQILNVKLHILGAAAAVLTSPPAAAPADPAPLHTPAPLLRFPHSTGPASAHLPGTSALSAAAERAGCGSSSPTAHPAADRVRPHHRSAWPPPRPETADQTSPVCSRHCPCWGQPVRCWTLPAQW